MREQTVFLDITAISTEWQQLLEVRGRRRANAVAFFDGRAPGGARELVFLNGEERLEAAVTDQQLAWKLPEFVKKVIEPLIHA